MKIVQQASCCTAGRALTIIPMMMRLLRKSLQNSTGQAVQPAHVGALSWLRVQVFVLAQAQKSVQPADALCHWLHLRTQW